MSKQKTPAMIPFQVKVRPDIRARIIEVATKRGLSGNDVAGMALAAGLDKVITKLEEIGEPDKQAA